MQLPTAPHTYFKVHNLDEARREFLREPTEMPELIYRQIDYAALRSHIETLQPGTHHRLALELVEAGVVLRQSTSKQHLDHFRALNQELYGEPDRVYAEAILGRAIRKASGKYDDIAAYIVQATPSVRWNIELYKPSDDLFSLLQGYIHRYTDVQEYSSDVPLPDMLRSALVRSGLDTNGWKVKVSADSQHAKTVHRNKVILIGKKYMPRAAASKLQIVMHEVYGHAMRGSQGNISESEGFAVLLEQLVQEQYSSRRTYRFLAAALGWGSVDRPRNFIETYEILWRVMVCGDYYSETDAKSHAFSECLRVFRGGNPDIPGAVFLKDSLYFKANIDIWRKFEQSPPSYEEFVDIIEGKRKVLV